MTAECPACEEQEALGFEHCSECGRPFLAAVPAVEEQPQDNTQENTRRNTEPAKTRKPRKKSKKAKKTDQPEGPACPECGAHVAGSFHYCASCGRPLDDKEENEEERADDYCPACHVPVTDDFAYCPECGEHLGQPYHAPGEQTQHDHFEEDGYSFGPEKNFFFRSPLATTLGGVLAAGLVIGVFLYLISGPPPATQQSTGQPSSAVISGNQQPTKDQLQREAKALEQRAQSDPADLLAWKRLGFIYLDLNEGKKSEAAFQKVLDQSPSDYDAVGHRGVARWFQGRVQEALVDLKKAVELAPNDQHAWADLATVEFQSGDQAKGLKLLQKVVKMGPKTPDGQNASKLLTGGGALP